MSKEILATDFGPEFIVTIDGKQYRAITPDHIRFIEKAIIDRDGALKEGELLRQQVALLREEADQLKAQVVDLRKATDISTQMNAQLSMIVKGQGDLLESQKKLEPSITTSFMNKWPMQVLTKIGIPAAGLFWSIEHSPFNPPKHSPCNP